jgi:hypothetical protein
VAIEAGLWVIDISMPSSPIMRGFIGIGGRVRNLYGLGGYVYVTARDSGLHIIDISSTFSRTAMISFLYLYSAEYVYVSGDYAYVLGDESLHKVNISDPSMPYIDYPGAYNIPGGNSLYVSGSYAYVADYYSPLYVIDLSRGLIIGSVETPGFPCSVYVSGNYAYVADGSSGLQVIDITTPSSPVIIGSVETPGYARDIYVSGNYAYVADGSSGLQVIDISTPSTPEIIGSVELLSDAEAIYISGTYAYVTEWRSEEAWQGLQVIDISTPSTPEIIGSVETSGYAWDVYVSGNYAYMTEWGSGEEEWRLQVIDISTPSTPEIIGSIETLGYGGDVYVSGNYAYLGGANLIIDISTPSSPAIITSTTYGGWGIYFSGDYAYVPKGEGLWVIKTSLITPILLEGNVEDSTTITATIPPSLPESAYNIIVTNPGGEFGILRNGFRVVDAVDVTPPVINDVNVIDITDTTAIVTWNTDEPSDSVVAKSPNKWCYYSQII